MSDDRKVGANDDVDVESSDDRASLPVINPGRYGKTLSALRGMKLPWVGVVTCLVALGGAYVDFREDMIDVERKSFELEEQKAELSHKTAMFERENIMASRSSNDAIMALGRKMDDISARIAWVERNMPGDFEPAPPDFSNLSAMSTPELIMRLVGSPDPRDHTLEDIRRVAETPKDPSHAEPVKPSDASGIRSPSGHNKVPGIDNELYEQRTIF